MGLDYIRAQTGKPWRKRWNGGLDRLKEPTLLDLTMYFLQHGNVVASELRIVDERQGKRIWLCFRKFRKGSQNN